MRQNNSYGNVPLNRPRLEQVPAEFRDRINDLFDTWESVKPRNQEIKRYYEMHNEMKNLGISIPPQCENVNSVVGWCSKAIAAHANRSKLDGFVSSIGTATPMLDELVRANRLRSLYQQAVKSALAYGMSTITVMKGGVGQPAAKVRVFSANQSCVLWDKDAGRIACGAVLADVDREGKPSKYVFHFPDAVLTMTRGRALDAKPAGIGRYVWECIVEANPMGRPMMEVLVHDPDPDRPLGHSMLTPELMGIVDKAMRDVLRMEVGAEFFTAPQRYILGASEDLFSAGTDEDGEPLPAGPKAKWQAYLGAFLALTKDEDGDIPAVGQFAAGDAGNFTKVFENDAQRFSGATNVPLAQLGVLSNTYTSSDALSATDNPLILEVEVMNERNRETMEEVARMMLAVAQDVPIDALSDSDKAIQASFRNPAMTTLSATADAWTKFTAYANWLPDTDVFWEQVGIDKPTRTRMKAEKSEAEITDALNNIADTLTQNAAQSGALAEEVNSD